MTDGNDLSAGTLSQPDKDMRGVLLREENERLIWKRVVLLGSCVLIVVFYGVFLRLALYLWKSAGTAAPLDHWHGAILLFIAVVPTLILMNLSKMVRRHHPESDADDNEIDWHPVVSLLKELAKAFGKKE
ncbi:MAG TPA: hypothetical protein VHX52_10190 [Steroidobacteraceae bacterium]|nr:hypothetical protein [Steroidobacteraceae bacterium]